MDYSPLKIYSSLSVDALYSVILSDYQKGFRFYGETHDIWEMTCVLKGRLGITSGENVYICEPYEVVVHPPGIFHTCWADGDTGYSCLTISFTGQGLDYFLPFGKIILKEEEKSHIDWLAREIPRIFVDSEFPPRVAEGVPKESIPRFKNMLELFILSLSADKRESAKPTNSRNAPLFSAISRYMHEHVCDSLDTAYICTMFGISRSTLKDMFHRFTGGGVMEYYHYLRINHAVSLMSEGMSMSQISILMNFSSQNYFSSFFKRQTGFSPAEYRKQKLQGK